MKDAMEKSVEPREFELPLELQFSMRKAEVAAQEMTWEELYYTLLNLYHQRLMEWQAVKEIMANEDIELNFDIPTDLELAELAAAFEHYADGDEEDEEELPF
jgi:hypothetical protein